MLFEIECSIIPLDEMGAAKAEALKAKIRAKEEYKYYLTKYKMLCGMWRDVRHYSPVPYDTGSRNMNFDGGDIWYAKRAGIREYVQTLRSETRGIMRQARRNYIQARDRYAGLLGYRNS